jgi:hypothetical protein
LYFEPNTVGAITTTDLTLNGAPRSTLPPRRAPARRGVRFSTPTNSASGPVALANAASYRVAPIIDDDGSRIAVTITDTRALTWKGSASAIWDNGATVNNNWDAGQRA